MKLRYGGNDRSLALRPRARKGSASADGSQERGANVQDSFKAAVLALHREGKGVSEIARATGLSRPTVYGLIG